MTLEGVVQARNDSGIRLDGEWVNRSKFRPVELPPAGARVRAEVDDKGFLKSIDVLDEHTAATASVSCDETITRLAVLKAADVLTIADRWLQWVQAT